MTNREQNIGIESVGNGSGDMLKANNLSDVANVATAKTNLGLSDVDNTSDLSKPVSTAQSTADNLRLLKTNDLSDLANVATAKTNLGLNNVDNTSDANKPVSTAQGTADNLRLLKTNNLSDLANITTAKTNLSLENVDNTSDATKNSAVADLTNKKVVPQVQSVVSNATVTPTDKNDLVEITALAVGLTLANPTGTLSDNQGIMIRVKDNGTARSIAYGTMYKNTDLTLPVITVPNETLYLGFIYNSADSSLDLIGIRRKA